MKRTMTGLLAALGLAAAALLVPPGATEPKPDAAKPAPIFKSHGFINVAPKLPKIITKTEETDLMPAFDQYMQSQVTLCGNRR